MLPKKENDMSAACFKRSQCLLWILNLLSLLMS